jgi:uncharacterized protein
MKEQLATATPKLRRSRWKTALIGLGSTLLLLYVALVAALFVFGDRLVFPAPKDFPSATPGVLNLPFEDLMIPVDASTQMHAWWIPAPTPTSKVILYFHGNGYALQSETKLELSYLFRTGANLLLADYRGYGTSSALHTTEATTRADGLAAIRYLVEQRHIAVSDVVIVGWSIGSAVAAQLAVDMPSAGGLALLSPISSVNETANQDWHYRLLLWPLQRMGQNEFDTEGKISAVHMPVLIMAGTEDEVAPPWMAQEIYAHANNPKTLKPIEGSDHNGFWKHADAVVVEALHSLAFGSTGEKGN